MRTRVLLELEPGMIVGLAHLTAVAPNVNCCVQGNALSD